MQQNWIWPWRFETLTLIIFERCFSMRICSVSTICTIIRVQIKKLGRSNTRVVDSWWSEHLVEMWDSDLNPFQLCTFQAHFPVIVECLESSRRKSWRRYWKTTFWTSSGGSNILPLVLVHFPSCSGILQWSISKTTFPFQIWNWNQRKRSFVEQFARLSNKNLTFATSQTNNPAVIPYRDVLFIRT